MKKTFSPEDFLTRAEKMKLIEFPTSDHSKVVVLPNNEAIGFKFNCYKAEYLRDYVEKQVFDQTVKEATKICENVWRQKKIQETEDFSLPLKYILYWAIFLSFLAFVLLIILVYDDGEDGLLYAAVLLISLAAGLTLLVVIRSLFMEPKFIQLEGEIMEQLCVYFDRQNQQIYLNKDLKWVIEPKFYWLELQILTR